MGEPTGIAVEVAEGIARVRLDRPEAANALHEPMWFGLRDTLRELDADPSTRVIVISGNGKHFCSGIDVAMLAGLKETASDPSPGHGAEKLRRTILDLQDCLTAVERCRKPVLAAVHGVCIGAGLDLAVACDLRYATPDASFVLKEVDMGLAADVGVLQRLPRIVGEGIAREMAYTCRPVSGTEAKELRLVNGVFDDADALEQGVAALAAELAAKSPLALRGTKQAITYARDHSVADGLDQIATWNSGALISADLQEAVTAFLEKRPGVYRD
ncbi:MULTISPECIES: crotonase/enoyl-CoA hydratase family protein [Pseudonocardia]|uniref:2,3-dehydroadipyl-CoA hydratase n=2 Tax=Pseudonocardia TaxID=1847 RepID=A0A1Y2MUR0_PSEAH|nr:MULTISPECIES: crotonase/enoyl-CoA hydratase family protein [Pseudonocardia]OSY38901.1 2,3-dehydroadipyl-CoA hydratase [Pseudonocardia autotrophica]TDN76157.1 enoyl-CoA hydratase [Pseudonocardia autotrophica]BBG00138.1 enoyl-CoA hydratase [Pseudonocardia autotrophica]GEC26103.1 enoyl-CoA hydratase [Pseudonocardia saturnea]